MILEWCEICEGYIDENGHDENKHKEES